MDQEVLDKFDAYKQRIIKTYVEWKIGVEVETEPLASPRICLENVLKALLFKKYNIKIFNKTNYEDICTNIKNDYVINNDNEQIEFPKWKGTFGIELCQELLKYIEKDLNKYSEGIKNITKCGNLYVHDIKKIYNEKLQKINKQLYEIVDFFFKTEKEDSWELIYIYPLISEAASSFTYQVANKIQNIKKLNYNDEKTEEVKNKYFNYIKIKCGTIRLEGTAKKVPIEDFFTHLEFEEIKNDNYLYKDSICEIIIGGPGSGKSTIIKCMAFCYAFPEIINEKYGNHLEDKYFPVYLRCRDIKNKITSPILEIIKYVPILAEIPEIEDNFLLIIHESIQDGSLLILIDGIDEIPKASDRKIFLENIETFLCTYPKINVVITSRNTILNQSISAYELSSYFKYNKIVKLTNKQIEEICIKWHCAIINNSEDTKNKAINLAIQINLDFIISNLAENPLILSSLLLIYYKEGYIPTNKVEIYSKVLKILIESWNIMGHEHEELDYEETEFQLALIAYLMTKNKQFVINKEDLKLYIQDARKQIDRKIDYTVNEFIYRLENRTGILINNNDSDYEFVHSNFQEYLTSIAIIKKYLPKEDVYIQTVKFIINNITNTYWQGVIRNLASQLDQNEIEKLIRYLIFESKNTNQKEWKLFTDFSSFSLDDKLTDNGSKYWIAYRKYCSNRLLGYLLLDEKDMGSLLFEAIEWYAKNPTDGHTVSSITLTKHGNSFKEKVKDCFFYEYDDKYSIRLIEVLFNMQLHEFTKYNLDNFYNIIKENIYQNNKVEKCMSILLLCYDLTLISPELAMLSDNNDDIFESKYKAESKIIKETSEIINDLLRTTDFNDPHYYIIITFVLSLYSPDEKSNNVDDGNINYLVYKNINCIDEYIKIFITGWINFRYYNIQRYTSYILRKLLKPNLKFDLKKEFPNIEEIIKERYQKPQNKFERRVTIYIGIIIGIKLGENYDNIKDEFLLRNY